MSAFPPKRTSRSAWLRATATLQLLSKSCGQQR